MILRRPYFQDDLETGVCQMLNRSTNFVCEDNIDDANGPDSSSNHLRNSSIADLSH